MQCYVQFVVGVGSYCLFLFVECLGFGGYDLFLGGYVFLYYVFWCLFVLFVVFDLFDVWQVVCELDYVDQ